jgi:hypothetical protein
VTPLLRQPKLYLSELSSCWRFPIFLLQLPNRFYYLSLHLMYQSALSSRAVSAISPHSSFLFAYFVCALDSIYLL